MSRHARVPSSGRENPRGGVSGVPGRPRRVALTGGIAAGKSVATRRLGELGATVIDHDVLAREVVEPGTPGLAAVADEFGPGVLRPDGTLDRAALGAVVFADATARERLNGIIHPRVRAASREAEASAVEQGADVVVHDIPLLVEAGLTDRFDLVIVVDAPADLRIRRLVGGRGMTEVEARQRVAAQADDADRRAVADLVWDGSRGVEHLTAQVDEWWRTLGRYVGR